MLVTFFADVHRRFALTRVPPLRLQPHKTSGVATLPEPMRVLDGQHIGRGDQVSYPLRLFEQRRFRIRLFGHFFNPPIIFLDARCCSIAWSRECCWKRETRVREVSLKAAGRARVCPSNVGQSGSAVAYRCGASQNPYAMDLEGSCTL